MKIPTRVPQKGFYYHYKHDPQGLVNNYAYEVVGVRFHTEENARPGEEHFLVYRPLYEAPVYKAAKELGLPCFDNRPLEMWMGNEDKTGKNLPRFTKITDVKIIAELEEIKQ